MLSGYLLSIWELRFIEELLAIQLKLYRPCMDSVETEDLQTELLYCRQYVTARPASAQFRLSVHVIASLVVS